MLVAYFIVATVLAISSRQLNVHENGAIVPTLTFFFQTCVFLADTSDGTPFGRYAHLIKMLDFDISKIVKDDGDAKCVINLDIYNLYYITAFAIPIFVVGWDATNAIANAHGVRSACKLHNTRSIMAQACGFRYVFLVQHDIVCVKTVTGRVFVVLGYGLRHSVLARAAEVRAPPPFCLCVRSSFH